MEVICILLPLALILAAGFVLAFVWAVRRGQYDDLDTPAVRMLHDCEPPTTRDHDSSSALDEVRE